MKTNGLHSDQLVRYPDDVFIGGGGGGVAYSITVSPLSVWTSIRPVRLVSVRYLLKGLVYWIEILYTSI